MRAWYYEQEGVRAMLVGHSQGGIQALKVLHELAGSYGSELSVVDPTTGEQQSRTTIVDPLTGAMVPYALADSDASFNLGAAVAFARSLVPGVWVAMNGVAHPWSNVRKNRERGVFEPLGD